MKMDSVTAACASHETDQLASFNLLARTDFKLIEMGVKGGPGVSLVFDDDKFSISTKALSGINHLSRSHSPDLGVDFSGKVNPFMFPGFFKFLSDCSVFGTDRPGEQWVVWGADRRVGTTC